MLVQENANLTHLNSLALAASCDRLVTLRHRYELSEICALSSVADYPALMLGGGSNIVFRSHVPGLVIHNQLRGKQILDATDKHAYVRMFAGENWHEAVMWTLDMGLCGLENLALIPGSAGAAPIQNIGAYGAEIAEHIDSVEVWDLEQQQLRMLKRDQCAFSYRSSLFKSTPGRYWIICITLKLLYKGRLKLGYQGLRGELDAMSINQPTAKDVAKAVINIRRRKLPDPGQLGNVGSFFKNPVVPSSLTQKLARQHPGLPVYAQTDETSKLSAAWLIESCDLKGFRDGNAGVYAKHALVLVNYGGASGSDICALAKKIQAAVNEKFGILLQPEPAIVPVEP